jgi:hypothetical protein
MGATLTWVRTYVEQIRRQDNKKRPAGREPSGARSHQDGVIPRRSLGRIGRAVYTRHCLQTSAEFHPRALNSTAAPRAITCASVSPSANLLMTRLAMDSASGPARSVTPQMRNQRAVPYAYALPLFGFFFLCIARLTKPLEEVRGFDPATVIKQFEIPHVEALKVGEKLKGGVPVIPAAVIAKYEVALALSRPSPRRPSPRRWKRQRPNWPSSG